MAMSDERRIPAGEPIFPHLLADARIVLEAGTHPEALFIEHSLHIRGEPGAVVDAGGAGAAVHIVGDGLRVSLSELVLQRGHAELGGGLRIEGASEVDASHLRFVRNTDRAGGAAIGATRGSLRLRASRVEGEVLFTGFSSLDAETCEFDGPVRLREGARLRLGTACEARQVDLRGNPSRTPVLVLDGGRVAELRQDPRFPGEVKAP
jgi:hypothetical protein